MVNNEAKRRAATPSDICCVIQGDSDEDGE